MATVHQPVSDMMLAVKSREIQRAMLAEMRGEGVVAARHFLAAAHLELVLAVDYDQVGQDDLARRSRISAASCLWRAGKVVEAREQFESILRENPSIADSLRQVIADLEREKGT